MLTPSLLRRLKYQALVKSHPQSGNRTTPTISFQVTITEIDSLDPLVTERDVLESPTKGRQAFLYTKEKISTGMFLVYEDKEYAIRGVAPFPEEEGYTLYQLILEDVLGK